MEISNWITLATGLVAGLGIGSVITTLVQYFLKKRSYALQSQREDLEKRYKVIILLMYAAVEYEKSKKFLRIHRPDLKNQQDVFEELKAEWYNMILFASEKTQQELHSFIENPDIENLKATAIAMRTDLGRGKLDHMIKELTFS